MSENTVSAGTKKWLGILVILGLTARLIASFLQPGFTDEAFVYYVTKGGFQAMIDVLRYDTHAPAFNIMMWPLIERTTSVFLLRLPIVLLSAINIFLSFALARRFFSERASLYVAAFIALSYSVWLTDAQLRTYGPLMLGLTAVWLGLIDIHRSGTPYPAFLRSPWNWITFYLVALLTATIHVTGTLSIGALALICGWMPSPKRWKVIFGLLTATIPTVAWFLWARTQPTLPPAIADAASYYLQFLFTPLYLLNAKAPNDIVYYLSYFGSPDRYANYIVGAYILGNALLWILLLVGCIRLIRATGWEGAVIVFGTLLPLLAILLSCLLGMQPYAPRYGLTYTLPFLLVWGQAIPRNFGRRCAQGAVGWSLALTLAFPFYTPLWIQYWQGAIDYINSQAQPGDTIGVYIPNTCYTFTWAYDPQNIGYAFSNDAYYHVNIQQKEDGSHLPVVIISQNELDDKFLERTRNHRLFLVLSQKFHGNGELNWLNDHFNIIDLVRYPSLTYWADVEVCTLVQKT